MQSGRQRNQDPAPRTAGEDLPVKHARKPDRLAVAGHTFDDPMFRIDG
jgi:hypothetical protein